MQYGCDCVFLQPQYTAMTVKQEEKLAQLKADLHSSEEVIVLKALKTIQKNGHPSLLPDLFNVYLQNEGEKIAEAVEKMLLELKVQAAAPILIEAIQDPQYASMHSLMLSVFWQSSISGTDYLVDLTRAGLAGAYLETLEALTAIENLDGPFPEEDIMECQLLVKEWLLKHTEADNRSLVESLYEVLQSLDRTIQ